MDLIIILLSILLLSWIGVVLVIVVVNIPILLVRCIITATVDFAKKLKPIYLLWIGLTPSIRFLWIGVTVICLMGLFPPWTEKRYSSYDGRWVEERPAGYYFLLSGPRTSYTSIKYRIDFPRLIIPCLIVGIITGAGMWTLKDRDK